MQQKPVVAATSITWLEKGHVLAIVAVSDVWTFDISSSGSDKVVKNTIVALLEYLNLCRTVVLAGSTSSLTV